jgi:hypothetical protein
MALGDKRPESPCIYPRYPRKFCARGRGSGRAGYIPGEPTAGLTAQGNVRKRKRGKLAGVSLDRTGAGGTAERRSPPIAADER